MLKLLKGNKSRLLKKGNKSQMCNCATREKDKLDSGFVVWYDSTNEVVWDCFNLSPIVSFIGK